jgi:peptidoglycan/xylan/chitin deacetylase (PgdA/CDA1 family)
MKRWDWTWEEPRAKARTETELSAEALPEGAGAATQPASAERFRRRRLAAGGAGIVLLLLIAAILAVPGSGRHVARASSSAVPRRAAAPRLSTAAEEARDRRAEEKAIDRVLAYAPAVSSGGARGNEVALTFDDGPGPYTSQLVGVLNSLHVRATFFAIGEEERYFSAGTQLELRSGDVVGDHTETHPMMASLSRRDQHEQLFEQIARIELLDGPRPRLFRPPYGSFDATTFKELRAMHLLMVLWSTDTKDYTRPGAHAIEQSALAGAHPGAIILMHDAGGDRSETIAALPSIVAGLRKRGLRPVTIPRLMLDDPPPRGLPIPKSLAGD